MLNPGENTAGGVGGSVVVRGGSSNGESGVGNVQLIGGSRTPGVEGTDNVGLMEINFLLFQLPFVEAFSFSFFSSSFVCSSSGTISLSE